MRHLTVRHWRRAGLAAAAGWMGYDGFAFWMARSVEVFLPDIWWLWFTIAAGWLAAYSIKPCSLMLYKMAGLCGGVALLSRVLSVTYTISHDLSIEPIDWARSTSLPGYTVLLMAWCSWWLGPVKRYQSVRQQRCRLELEGVP